MSSRFHPITIPLITDRLVLRSWSLDDVQAVRGDRRSTSWAADFPTEENRSVADLILARSAWLYRHGHRLVVEQRSGLLIGSVGLFWPPRHGVVELGYSIAPSRRGIGYTAEAVRAIVKLALAHPAVRVVRAETKLSNPAAPHTLTRAGLRRREGHGSIAWFEATAESPATTLELAA